MSSDLTQLFIQYILAAGCIHEPVLAKSLAHVNSKEPDSERLTLPQLYESVVPVFMAMGMDLRKIKDVNFGGSAYYMVVPVEPTQGEFNSLLLNTSVAVQVKDMIGEMLEDSRCQGVPLHMFTRTKYPARDEIVSRFLHEERFVNIGDCHNETLFLGTRLVNEIENYLKEEFGGRLFACNGCMEWFLSGSLCSNHECTFRLHEACYDPYFHSNRLQPGACPKCGFIFEQTPRAIGRTEGTHTQGMTARSSNGNNETPNIESSNLKYEVH